MWVIGDFSCDPEDLRGKSISRPVCDRFVSHGHTTQAIHRHLWNNLFAEMLEIESEDYTHFQRGSHDAQQDRSHFHDIANVCLLCPFTFYTHAHGTGNCTQLWAQRPCHYHCEAHSPLRAESRDDAHQARVLYSSKIPGAAEGHPKLR